MSTPTSILAIVTLYLLLKAATYLPRLMALIIASGIGSVLVRRNLRSNRALIGASRIGTADPWERSTRVQRRLLRRALRDTMRLTVHRSLFPSMTSY